jgi:hypothetical protein
MSEGGRVDFAEPSEILIQIASDQRLPNGPDILFGFGRSQRPTPIPSRNARLSRGILAGGVGRQDSQNTCFIYASMGTEKGVDQFVSIQHGETALGTSALD